MFKHVHLFIGAADKRQPAASAATFCQDVSLLPRVRFQFREDVELATQNESSFIVSPK